MKCWLAVKAGFESHNIIFVGPAKNDREIQACIDHNIYAIICEFIDEIKRISDIACQCCKKIRVALRINPSHLSKSALLKMGGKPSQFGMDEEIIFRHKEYFMSVPHI